MDDYCIQQDKAHQLEPEVAPSDQPLPWEAWDAYIEKNWEHPAAKAKAFRAALAAGTSTTTGGGISAGDGARAQVDGGEGSFAAAAARKKDIIPPMPTVPYEPKHRPKLRPRVPINACVARPVSSKEQKANDKARAAMKDEWKRLRDMGTYLG